MERLKCSAIYHTMIDIIKETHPQVLDCDDLISKEMIANVVMKRIVSNIIRQHHVIDEVRNLNFYHDTAEEADRYCMTDGYTNEGHGKLRDFMIEYKTSLESESVELNEKFHEWYRMLVERVNPNGTVKSKEEENEMLKRKNKESPKQMIQEIQELEKSPAVQEAIHLKIKGKRKAEVAKRKIEKNKGLLTAKELIESQYMVLFNNIDGTSGIDIRKLGLDEEGDTVGIVYPDKSVFIRAVNLKKWSLDEWRIYLQYVESREKGEQFTDVGSVLKQVAAQVSDALKDEDPKQEQKPVVIQGPETLELSNTIIGVERKYKIVTHIINMVKKSGIVHLMLANDLWTVDELINKDFDFAVFASNTCTKESVTALFDDGKVAECEITIDVKPLSSSTMFVIKITQVDDKTDFRFNNISEKGSLADAPCVTSIKNVAYCKSISDFIGYLESVKRVLEASKEYEKMKPKTFSLYREYIKRNCSMIIDKLMNV